jgi:hypothetical protein
MSNKQVAHNSKDVQLELALQLWQHYSNPENSKDLDKICREYFPEYNEREFVNGHKERYPMTYNQAWKLLKKAREFKLEELNDIMQGYFLEVVEENRRLKRELREYWERTNDVAAVQQMRAIDKDVREMFSLDKPKKAPIDAQTGKTVQPLVFVMNDSKFREIEKTMNYDANVEVVDGTINEPKQLEEPEE